MLDSVLVKCTMHYVANRKGECIMYRFMRVLGIVTCAVIIGLCISSIVRVQKRGMLHHVNMEVPYTLLMVGIPGLGLLGALEMNDSKRNHHRRRRRKQKRARMKKLLKQQHMIEAAAAAMELSDQSDIYVRRTGVAMWSSKNRLSSAR